MTYQMAERVMRHMQGLYVCIVMARKTNTEHASQWAETLLTTLKTVEHLQGICWLSNSSSTAWYPLPTQNSWPGGPVQELPTNSFLGAGNIFFLASKTRKKRQTMNKQESKFWQDENWLPSSSKISDCYPGALIDKFNNWQSPPHVESHSTCGDNCWLLFVL